MKAKRVAGVLSICAAICLTFGLFACKAESNADEEELPPPPPVESVSYDITFDANGGKFADGSITKIVKTDADTGKVTPPAEPVKSDFSFLYWGKSATAAAAINFSAETFSANATVYAVWEEIPEVYPDESEWDLDLAYEEVKSGDGVSGYSVHSEGQVSADGRVVIAAEYKGKPVVEIKSDGFSEWGDTLKEIFIPDGVKKIGDRAFYQCKLLTEVKIPASVTEIAGSAFWNCTALKKAVFAGGGALESIADNAFNGSGVTSLNLPQGLKTIGGGAFAYCDLTSVTLPVSLETLGEGAFEGCAALASAEVGDGLEKIESYAFKDCVKLSRVVLPDSVTEISSGAFEGCAALQEMQIPSELYKLGRHAFAGTGLKSVTLPASLNSCADAVFADCALESIVVESGNEKFYVESDCFIYVYNNKTAYKIIASWAKGDLTLPKNTKYGIKIGEEAFSGCKITGVVIPAGCDYIGQRPFKNCRLLESVEVAVGNQDYKSKGNCLIDTYLHSLLAGCKNSVIPADEGITKIDVGAFEGCDIASVTIPAQVTEIGNFAFNGCRKLTLITFGGTRTAWSDVVKGVDWQPSAQYTLTCADD